MNSKTSAGLVLAAFAGFIALLILGGSFTIIDPGERGVVTRWGSLTGSVFNEGLSFKKPFIEGVDVFNVQIQKYDAQPENASSKDMQSVNTSVTVNWRLSPDHVVEIRREFGTYDLEIYNNRALQPALRGAIKAITARYEADELLAHRAEIRTEMQNELQSRLGNLVDGGFEVIEFAITDFAFSNTFNTAIEAKVKAEQAALQTENEVRQAEAEAEKSVAKAEGEAEATKLRANAEADAIRIRAAALKENPEILRLDAIQRWDGRLPVVMGENGQGLMLNLNDLKSN